MAGTQKCWAHSTSTALRPFKPDPDFFSDFTGRFFLDFLFLDSVFSSFAILREFLIFFSKPGSCFNFFQRRRDGLPASKCCDKRFWLNANVDVHVVVVVVHVVYLFRS